MLQQSVELCGNAASKLPLFRITGNEQRGVRSGNFHPERLLDPTQVFVVVTEEVVEKAMILKL
jgi:hypothetical protein